MHKRLTGDTNELILDNLSRLCRQGLEVEIRYPLVVGYNDGELKFSFIPAKDSYPDIESYHNVREWLNTLNTLSFRDFCEKSNGYETFYASNEMFCIECPVNKLVNIAVPFTDMAIDIGNCNNK